VESFGKAPEIPVGTSNNIDISKPSKPALNHRITANHPKNLD